MAVVGKIWRAARRKPSVMLDFLTATVELALARWKFGWLEIGPLIESARPVEEKGGRRALGPNDRMLIERVRFAIPAVGSRLPFRADCLIQALAAQRWLGRHRIASTLNIGVRTGDRAPFEAHAWLMRDGEVITGGDVTGYKELVGQAQVEVARP